MNNNNCEICGVQAVIWIRDVTDTTKEGDRWTSRATHSKHAFCKDHKRDPIVYSQEGKILETLKPIQVGNIV